LERRITDVDALDSNVTNRRDPRIQALEVEIGETQCCVPLPVQMVAPVRSSILPTARAPVEWAVVVTSTVQPRKQQPMMAMVARMAEAEVLAVAPTAQPRIEMPLVVTEALPSSSSLTHRAVAAVAAQVPAVLSWALDADPRVSAR
jgi:hypothetical protein